MYTQMQRRWQDRILTLQRLYENLYVTCFQTAPIKFHSQGDVTMPCMWMKTDNSSFNWSHQNVKNKAVLVVISWVNLQGSSKKNIVQHFCYSLLIHVSVQMNKGFYPELGRVNILMIEETVIQRHSSASSKYQNAFIKCKNASVCEHAELIPKPHQLAMLPIKEEKQNKQRRIATTYCGVPFVLQITLVDVKTALILLNKFVTHLFLVLKVVSIQTVR